MPKIIEKKLIEEFKNRASFTRKELFDFFRFFEPDLKEGTFGWRIYDLKNKDIIKSIKRDLYTISFKPKFKPQISPELQKLAKRINEQYEEVKYCLWDTIWLNEFSQHQSTKRIKIIEIERDYVESLYYHMKDNFDFDIYLNPDEKVIEFYIAESYASVIIKRLITRSPVGKSIEDKVTVFTPFLEKILVDLFCEEKIFYFYQGSELNHIYKNAIKSYTINFTKLLSYARRREREQELKMYLSRNMDHMLSNIIND